MHREMIVTGASGGIGQSTALYFLEKGWKVYGLDIQEWASPPEGVKFLLVDAADPDSVRDGVKRISDQTDTIDAVVNNAALQICKPLVEMTTDEWDRVHQTNLRAAFLLVKECYPFLKRAKGAVVNVSSVHAIATSADIAAYAASKGGLVALTRAMAIEFASDGIRVNAVLPGAVDTPMLRDGLSRGHVSGGDIEARLGELAAKTVMQRVGEPEEIAKSIYFLADTDMSSYMTGQALVVDGGATIRLSTE